MRRALGRSACIVVCLVCLGVRVHAQDADHEPGDPAGGAVLHLEEVRQIVPPSPVAGGNDPNASDDVLYVLEANDEDAVRRAKLGRKAHMFVNPSGRAAASLTLSPALTIEAFATTGLAAFDERHKGFGTRNSSASGGFNATGDLKAFNLSLAYEHRDAHTDWFGPWSATSDKVGLTVNKTYPFFVQNLRLTPQVQASRVMVDPFGGSAANIEGTIGLTYDASPRLSFAGSAGYEGAFLFGVSGSRRNHGLKANVGATFRATDKLTLIAGASTSRTFVYGLVPPATIGSSPFVPYRTDGSISPQVTARYQMFPCLTLSLVASYQRFVSTATGQGTFKYNINPSVALTVPL